MYDDGRSLFDFLYPTNNLIKISRISSPHCKLHSSFFDHRRTARRHGLRAPTEQMDVVLLSWAPTRTRTSGRTGDEIMRGLQAVQHHTGIKRFPIARVVYLASRRVVYWSSCLNNSPIIILNDYCYCDMWCWDEWKAGRSVFVVEWGSCKFERFILFGSVFSLPIAWLSVAVQRIPLIFFW